MARTILFVPCFLLLSCVYGATGQCAPFAHTGVDFADANLTVIPVAAGGAGKDECCTAGAQWNAVNATSPETTCKIAVWHNLQAEAVCVLKATADKPIQGHLVLAMSVPVPPPSFAFAAIYTSHMVLTAAPNTAHVWGFCQRNESKVTVSLDGKAVATTITRDNAGQCRFSAYLPVVEASTTNHTVSAFSEAESTRLVLSDVLFGDVWVCSVRLIPIDVFHHGVVVLQHSFRVCTDCVHRDNRTWPML